MSASDHTQGICVFVGLEKGVEKTSIYEVIQKTKEVVSPVVDGNILTSSYVSLVPRLISSFRTREEISLVTLGVQTVDFRRLRQGASNQIAEQNHVDA